MKNTMKALSFCLLIVISISSFAQENFATYSTEFTKDYGPYEIRIAIDEKGKSKYELWIDAYPLEDNKKGGITLDKKEYENFVRNLEAAKAKFKDWSATAKANNVTSLVKKMDNLEISVGGFFRYGGDIYFDFSVPLNFYFQIITIKEKTTYLLNVKAGKMISSSNQFIDTDGFSFYFTSEEEINTFLNEISYPKINDFLIKPKAKDLFKD